MSNKTIGGIVRSENWTPQKHLNGLTANVSAVLMGKDKDELYKHGLPLTQALRADQGATRVLLLGELTRTWRAVKVGENKTWTDQEALQDAVEDVCEIFPTMKVEEILSVFRDIRLGKVKLYGRFDTPTLVEALRDYEDKYTTTFREAEHRKAPNENLTGGTHDVSTAIREVMEKLRVNDGRTSEMWLRGSNNMNPRQREELQEKDRQRRSQ